MNSAAPRMMKESTVLFRTGAVSAGLLAAILMAEIGIRIIFPVKFPYMATYPDGFFIASDACGYHQATTYPPVERKHKDGIHTNLFMTNSYGMHDPEPGETESGDSVKILAIGCSQTEGVGIKDLSKTWPRQLQQNLDILDDSSRRFTVMNGGVIGHNTWQQTAHATELTQRVRPDLWLMAYYGQDLIGMWGRNTFGKTGQYRLQWDCLWEADYIEHFLGKRTRLNRRLMDHSVLWRWLMFISTDFDLKSEVVERAYRDHPGANLDAIRDFARTAGQYGARPVLVFMPGLGGLETLKEDAGASDWIRSGIVKICKDVNLKWIDLTEDMLESLKSGYPGRTAHEAWSVSEKDKPHYNTDAHEVFATHLARRLLTVLEEPDTM